MFNRQYNKIYRKIQLVILWMIDLMFPQNLQIRIILNGFCKKNLRVLKNNGASFTQYSRELILEDGTKNRRIHLTAEFLL